MLSRKICSLCRTSSYFRNFTRRIALSNETVSKSDATENTTIATPQVIEDTSKTDETSVSNPISTEVGKKFYVPKHSEPSKISVFEKCENEDVSHVAPYLRPTFNFAAYVNDSVTLQELLKLGVELHRLETKRDVPQYVLGLDFERDVKGHVVFLHEIGGVNLDTVGKIITSNPFIFKESLDDMQVRINYLESKRFTREMIVRILSINKFWLSFSTQEIDSRLGFFQKEFDLSGDEVRAITTLQPNLITYDENRVKVNIFGVREEMGFNPEECKQILLKKPKIYMIGKRKLLETFEYLHRDMNTTHDMLVKCPGVMTCRKGRLKERHLFLQKLGKIQFEPKEPGYISLVNVVKGTDAEFCENVAKCPLPVYNAFLKSL